MSVTREEVINGYRMILGREPESEEVIEQHMRIPTFEDLRLAFFSSKEYIHKNKIISFQEKWVCAEVYGGKYRIWLDLGDKYVSYGCLIDDYEHNETNFIRNNVKAGSTVLDIGANIGWHTLGLVNAVGETGHVISFEPRNPTSQYLARTIEDNGLASIVKLHHFGLWDDQRSAGMIWEENTVNPGNSFINVAGNSKAIKQTIELRRIDDLDLPETDFIKIDVEGAEPRVLLGAKEYLQRYKPLILAELHPKQLSLVSMFTAVEFIKMMADMNYQCLIIESGFEGVLIEDFPSQIGRELINVVFAPENMSVIINSQCNN